jgi:hypothetical protein
MLVEREFTIRVSDPTCSVSPASPHCGFLMLSCYYMAISSTFTLPFTSIELLLLYSVELLLFVVVVVELKVLCLLGRVLPR